MAAASQPLFNVLKETRSLIKLGDKIKRMFENGLQGCPHHQNAVLSRVW